MVFKNNFLKKASLFLFLFFFFFSFSSFVLSASASDVLGTDFISDDINLSDRDPRTMAAGIINVVLSILGIIAVSIVIYGGFIWMNSEGNEENVQKAKDILKMGVIGLVIILSAWGISAFVLNKLGSSTGTTSSVCQDGDTKPCGRGGISTCLDGVWGPCIGSNCIPGDPGSWCSSALGICEPDNSLCNPGLFCNNSCVCQYDGLGEPCGQVDLAGVCNNQVPPTCSNPALVCGEECLCIPPDGEENFSELGEICDSTGGDGVAGVCATDKVCNPNHALTCEDCKCIGNPVITGFSPVGG
ncbi:MAG: pilin, partial [Patescibacteria group bacterium]